MAHKRGKPAAKAARLVSRARGVDCPTPDKVGYLTRSDARRRCRAEKQKLGKGGQHLNVYLCGCGFYHLGNAYGRADGMTRSGEVQPLQVQCAVRLRGTPCGWPAVHPVLVAGREVWLCDEHKVELDALAERARRAKAAAA